MSYNDNKSRGGAKRGGFASAGNGGYKSSAKRTGGQDKGGYGEKKSYGAGKSGSYQGGKSFGNKEGSYGKKPYANGCRLGNIIYRIESEDEALEHTFRLSTKVLNTFTLKAGKSVAYSHAYTAREDCRIATVPSGFGDGFAKMNIGRDVFIGGKRFPIVAVTMDISHILVDDSVKAGDEVLLIRDNHHLDEIAAHIHGATEEAICALNKRVRREYIREETV